MKTKYIKYSMSALAVLTLGLTGCSDDIVQSAIETYNNSTDEKTTTNGTSSSNTPQYTAGTIKYADGSNFGVTKAEAMNNGGFQIYSIGTGEVIGFIQVDGSVNDIGGNDLGVCKNATITDAGLEGDCVVPASAPTAPQPKDNGNTQNTTDISDSGYPAIPNYPVGANSIGQLDLNCKNDIIYYTLSYICFKNTVKLSTTVNGKPIVEDEDSKRGSNPYIYYERGQYDRDGSGRQVEIVGTVTGGNPGGTYRKTCPGI